MKKWSPEVETLLEVTRVHEPVGTPEQLGRVLRGLEQRLEPTLPQSATPPLGFANLGKRGVDGELRHARPDLRSKVGVRRLMANVAAAYAATWMSVAAFAATGAAAGWVVVQWSPLPSSAPPTASHGGAVPNARPPRPPVRPALVPDHAAALQAQAAQLAAASEASAPTEDLTAASNAGSSRLYEVTVPTNNVGTRRAHRSAAVRGAKPTVQEPAEAAVPESKASSAPSTSTPHSLPAPPPDVVTTRQLEVLGQANEALRHRQHDLARRILDSSASLFEATTLEEEYRFLKAATQCSMDPAGARGHAEGFRRLYPLSAFLPRVDDACVHR